MPSSFSLRPADESDGDFLFQLHRETLAHEFALPGMEFLARMQFQAREQSYRAAFPQAVNMIVLRDTGPVGRMLVARSETEIRILDLAVLTTERGCGAGSFALRALSSEAALKGKPLRLSVLKTNDRARNLYERHGFHVTHTNEIYLEMERW